MADQLTDAANVETCRMLNQAQTKCEHFLSDAGAKAGNMVDEAPVRAETNSRGVGTAVPGKGGIAGAGCMRRHTEVLDALSQ